MVLLSAGVPGLRLRFETVQDPNDGAIAPRYLIENGKIIGAGNFSRGAAG